MKTEICDFSRRLANMIQAGCHIGNELGVTRFFLSLIVISVFEVKRNIKCAVFDFNFAQHVQPTHLKL